MDKNLILRLTCGMSLQRKTKSDNYPEHAGVNQADIRWKDYILNWGGLTDMHNPDKPHGTREAWSKACREKSAEVEVPKARVPMGKDRTFIEASKPN
jgi:hypothetical protein